MSFPTNILRSLLLSRYNHLTITPNLVQKLFYMLNIISFWGPHYVTSIFVLCLLILLSITWLDGPNDLVTTYISVCI
jgi:hypothetical protein